MNRSTPYRISLFDDLHNYLPELLYNRGRFHNVQDILDYVHTVASTQLNPWTTAVADYTTRMTDDEPGLTWDNSYNYTTQRYASGGSGATRRQQPRRYAGQQQQRQNHQYNPRTGATIQPQQPTAYPYSYPRSLLRTPVIQPYNSATYYNNYGYGLGAATATAASPWAQQQQPQTSETMELLNLFNAAFGLIPPATVAAQPQQPGTTAARRQQWLEPVIVRPTHEQIEAASHSFMIADLSADAVDRCAICQDEFVEGAAARRLTVCRHLFHRECIDRWFNSSVRCPVCRYDIRVPATPPTSAEESPQQPETVSSDLHNAAAVSQLPQTPEPNPQAISLSDSQISDSAMSAAVEALMSLITGTGATNAGDNITIRIEVEDESEPETDNP